MVTAWLSHAAGNKCPRGTSTERRRFAAGSPVHAFVAHFRGRDFTGRTGTWPVRRMRGTFQLGSHHAERRDVTGGEFAVFQVS